MRLTAHFPRTTTPQPLLEGVVEVAGPAHGVGLTAADAYLTQQGRNATTPIAQDAIGVRFDLSENETTRVPAFVGPLVPGEYELYVELTITPDDGPPVHATAGPWPLTVLSP